MNILYKKDLVLKVTFSFENERDIMKRIKVPSHFDS